MTREWKNVIKAKRRFTKKLSENPTPKNCEIKTWRNEATKERRKVSDNIKFDPRKFYRTFRPFTNLKNKQGSSSNICLKVNDVLEGDQNKVVNHLANFSLHNG